MLRGLISQRGVPQAIGCIIYTIAFFKHPFAEVGNLGILNGQYKIPARHSYSDDLVLMIRRCFQIRPDDRPSCQDLLNHISFMKHSVGERLGPVIEAVRASKLQWCWA